MNNEKTNLELLNEAIGKQIENLNNIEPGSEDHDRATESLVKLYKLKMEEEFKNVDSDIKKTQLMKENFNSYMKLGVEVAGIVLPLVFYASWMKKGLKFEETGTFTSTTFKSLFQKFKTTR